MAAIIVEPLQRIIPPAPGFLELLRQECDRYGIVLIFDEVVTGFRFAYGGAQEYYGVTPDVTTLGKVIGGGFPLAAIVGRRDIMAHFDKSDVGADKWLMQLGTLSGNPIAAAAGLKSLEILNREGAYDHLLGLGNRVSQMIRDALGKTGVPFPYCRASNLIRGCVSRHSATGLSHGSKRGCAGGQRHGMTHCAPMASSNHPAKPIQV